jgi:calcineurin-like phosphoesterase family protein
MKTYFISDPHFYHENIIKYENRPFHNVDEMNNCIIANWNNTVSKRDTVYCMGDVSFGGKDKTFEIVPRLNGGKILILGNHDRCRKPRFWREAGFAEAIEYPIIYKGFYILSHEPVYLNDNVPYVNIHGHIHHMKMESNKYFNVSVECINYKPIELKEIQEIVNTK